MSTTFNLLELDNLPDGLLERPASALYQQLKGPTLIHLEGRIKRPLFVSVLQHGNEVTGWEAIRRLLKSHYQHDDLPRSMLILIGNVQAAKHRLRADPTGNIEILDVFWNLPNNPDYPDVVPPILAYADLVATIDPRNLEAAKLLREEHIEHALHQR